MLCTCFHGARWDFTWCFVAYLSYLIMPRAYCHVVKMLKPYESIGVQKEIYDESAL